MTEFHRALIEVTIAAPAEEVWRSLRDPARIAQWFGWDSDSLKAEIDMIFMKPGRADDARRTMTFMSDRFEVEPRGKDSCVLRVMRPAPAEGTDWEDIFEDLTQGWLAFVGQLRFAVERHPDHKRRTLFVSGAPLAAGQPLAGKALGLPAEGAAGAPYATTAPMGDALAGRIWYRGRHQLQVTVDGVGDGLLVVMDRQPDEKRPKGHSQVILTTYGLDDRTFDELAARWRTWWTAHFDSSMPGCE